MGKLNDKVVVVTGSVSAIPGYDSIGSATVREALAEGAAGVVISDINDELGEAFALAASVSLIALTASAEPITIKPTFPKWPAA